MACIQIVIQGNWCKLLLVCSILMITKADLFLVLACFFSFIGRLSSARFSSTVWQTESDCQCHHICHCIGQFVCQVEVGLYWSVLDTSNSETLSLLYWLSCKKYIPYSLYKMIWSWIYTVPYNILVWIRFVSQIMSVYLSADMPEVGQIWPNLWFYYVGTEAGVSIHWTCVVFYFSQCS